MDFLYSPIFVQSNLTLLLLTLGAAGNLFFLCHKQHSLKKGVAEFWSQEQSLFGGWASELRKKAGPWLFLAAAAMLQLIAFFFNSLFRDTFLVFTADTTLLLYHLLGACLLAKILFCSRYSGRQLVIAWPALFILRWVFFNNHNTWFMLGVLFALAAKDVPLHRPLKVCLLIGTISVLLTGLLASVGIIPDGNMVMGEDRVRYAFGYGWPNLLGVYLVGLAVMYVCWRGIQKIRWYDFVLLTALTVFCDAGPDSRSAVVCLLVLIFGLLAVKFRPALFANKAVRVCISLLPLIAFGLSLWLSFCYDPENALLEKLNLLLSGRIQIGNSALLTYPLRIAGQPIYESPSIVLDNAYVHFWLTGGPVATALVWCGVCALLWKLLKGGHLTEMVCVTVFLFHGFMEKHLFWPCVNVTVWLMAGVLFAASASHFPVFSEDTKKENET